MTYLVLYPGSLVLVIRGGEVLSKVESVATVCLLEIAAVLGKSSGRRPFGEVLVAFLSLRVQMTGKLVEFCFGPYDSLVCGQVGDWRGWRTRSEMPPWVIAVAILAVEGSGLCWGIGHSSAEKRMTGKSKLKTHLMYVWL